MQNALWSGTQAQHTPDAEACVHRVLDTSALSGAHGQRVAHSRNALPSEMIERTSRLLRCAPCSLAERFHNVLHCFISFVICNMDRINLSIAIIPMSKHFGWSETIQGFVQSAFFYGYMITQIYGGRVADRIGGRRVLAAGVTVWSIMTLLTPIAAYVSLSVLLLVRVLLGVGEGVAMPAMNAIVAVWIPPAERARSLSFVYSGMYAGSIMGLLLTPVLYAMADWPLVFYVFGAAGLIWVAIFLLTTAERPETSNTISGEEREYIVCARSAALTTHTQSNARALYTPVQNDEEHAFAQSEPNGAVNIPGVQQNAYGNMASSEHTANTVECEPTLMDIFSRRCVWAIIIAHFCCTWGYFVMLTWLPTYLSSRFHLNVAMSSVLSISPWISMFVAANVGGAIADQMISRGYNTTFTRKTMQSIGFLGPAIFLYLLAGARSPSAAVWYVSAGLGLAAFSQSGVYANHQDIGPQCAGVLLGISNTFASIPGIVGVAITGVILDATSNNWAAVFYLSIAFYAFGLLVYNLFATSEKQW